MKQHLLVLSIIACTTGIVFYPPNASASTTLTSKQSLNAITALSGSSVNYTGTDEDGNREPIETGKQPQK